MYLMKIYLFNNLIFISNLKLRLPWILIEEQMYYWINLEKKNWVSLKNNECFFFNDSQTAHGFPILNFD